MHQSQEPGLVIMQQEPQLATGLDLCPSTQPHCLMQFVPLIEDECP